MNALIAPDQVRQDFFAHERLVTTLYRAVKPDPVAIQFAGRVACISAIGDAMRAKLHPNPADISVIMGGINALLDDSITGVTLREHGPAAIDLSKINFKALADRFATSKHKNTDLETLKAAIRAQLAHLIELNPTRADFAAKFEELIDSYNNGSRNIEQVVNELLKLSLGLTDEEQRHDARRYRVRTRRRPPARLHAGVVQSEVQCGLRARLRQVPRARRWGVFGDVGPIARHPHGTPWPPMLEGHRSPGWICPRSFR